jgi:hypothetical protein
VREALLAAILKNLQSPLDSLGKNLYNEFNKFRTSGQGLIA